MNKRTKICESCPVHTLKNAVAANTTKEKSKPAKITGGIKTKVPKATRDRKRLRPFKVSGRSSTWLIPQTAQNKKNMYQTEHLRRKLLTGNANIMPPYASFCPFAGLPAFAPKHPSIKDHLYFYRHDVRGHGVVDYLVEDICVPCRDKKGRCSPVNRVRDHAVSFHFFS